MVAWLGFLLGQLLRDSKQKKEKDIEGGGGLGVQTQRRNNGEGDVVPREDRSRLSEVALKRRYLKLRVLFAEKRCDLKQKPNSQRPRPQP